MSSDLRTRVLAAAARTPSPTRAESRKRAAMILAAGIVATALFFATTGVHIDSRPTDLVLTTTGLGLLAALFLTHVALGQTRSMLGRSRSVLVGAIVLVGLALTASALVMLVWWRGGEPAPMPAHFACAGLTIAQGVALFVALFVLRRGTDPVHPAITGAALGMTVGAWTITIAYLRCPHADAMHCVVSHVVPAMLFAIAGAFVGRTMLKIR